MELTEEQQAHFAAIPPREDWEAALRVLDWEAKDFMPHGLMQPILATVRNAVERDMRGYRPKRVSDV